MVVEVERFEWPAWQTRSDAVLDVAPETRQALAGRIVPAVQ